MLGMYPMTDAEARSQRAAAVVEPEGLVEPGAYMYILDTILSQSNTKQ